MPSWHHCLAPPSQNIKRKRKVGGGVRSREMSKRRERKSPTPDASYQHPPPHLALPTPPWCFLSAPRPHSTLGLAPSQAPACQELPLGYMREHFCSDSSMMETLHSCCGATTEWWLTGFLNWNSTHFSIKLHYTVARVYNTRGLFI